MKRNFLHALLLAAAVITLASCSDDDAAPSNNFSYDGNTKKITETGTVYLDTYPTTIGGKDVYYHDLDFSITEGVEKNAKFSSIYFTVSSFTKTFNAGTYTFSGKYGSGKDLEINDGSLYVDISWEFIDQAVTYDFVSGTFTVTVSDGVYTIDGEGTAAEDGKTANAKPFKIHYKGKLSED